MFPVQQVLSRCSYTSVPCIWSKVHLICIPKNELPDGVYGRTSLAVGECSKSMQVIVQQAPKVTTDYWLNYYRLDPLGIVSPLRDFFYGLAILVAHLSCLPRRQALAGSFLALALGRREALSPQAAESAESSEPRILRMKMSWKVCRGLKGPRRNKARSIHSIPSIR